MSVYSTRVLSVRRRLAPLASAWRKRQRSTCLCRLLAMSSLHWWMARAVTSPTATQSWHDFYKTPLGATLRQSWSQTSGPLTTTLTRQSARCATQTGQRTSRTGQRSMRTRKMPCCDSSRKRLMIWRRGWKKVGYYVAVNLLNFQHEFFYYTHCTVQTWQNFWNLQVIFLIFVLSVILKVWVK